LEKSTEYLGKGLERPPGITTTATYLGGLAKDEKVKAGHRTKQGKIINGYIRHPNPLLGNIHF